MALGDLVREEVGSPPQSASPPFVWLMAVACGVSVANIYYNQPLLAQMARTLHGNSGYIPTYTQVGAGLGMFLFVPLGDIFERRRLIVSVCAATCAAAMVTALAPNLALLGFASLLLGLTSITPHLILPFAAQISAPEERGKVIGAVLSGLLIGILLARTASGFLGAWLGWRPVYWLAAVLMLGLALILRGALPASPPSQVMSYSQLLRSIIALIREQPLLREASLIGAMLFGAFSVFWATLIFVLVTPPYHYGSRMAGLFGLIGVAGALAASIAGRVADRRGPRFTVRGYPRHAPFLCGFLLPREPPLGVDRRRDAARSRRADRTRLEPNADLSTYPRGAEPFEYRLYGLLFRRAGHSVRLLARRAGNGTDGKGSAPPESCSLASP